ncbi:MAG: hypothetical protein ACREQ5_34710, partial [Candidatus Dormibacteria bacterium]
LAIAATVVHLTAGYTQLAPSPESARFAGTAHGVVVATGVGDGILGGPSPGSHGWWTRSLVITRQHPKLMVSTFHRTDGTIARLFERLSPCPTS